MRPLDFSPLPGGPTRALFDAAVIDSELSALAARQHDDGGWAVDFDSYSPAAATGMARSRHRAGGMAAEAQWGDRKRFSRQIGTRYSLGISSCFVFQG